MELFYVARYGVYMHGVFGVYSNVERAIKAAHKAKSAESDNYHSFKVIKVMLDVDAEADGEMSAWIPEYEGGEVVFELNS